VSDLIDGLAALDDNADEYIKAAAYFQGTVTEVFWSDDSLTRRLQADGRRYRVNMAKVVVDAVADRLEIAAVTVPNDKAATARLQQDVWDANQLTLETPEINRWACAYGDAYLLVWPTEDDAGHTTVQVLYNNPITTRIIYDEETQRRKLYAIKSWWYTEGPRMEQRKRRRATLYYPDRIERWITAQPGLNGDRDEDWMPYQEEGRLWPEPNPHGEVPMFHLRTASPYGTPEHRDAYGPQDALNKINITAMSAIDYAGFPIRYALMEANAELEGNANFHPDFDSDADATANNRGHVNLQARANSIWLASGLKGVGQLDPADPKHFIDPASFQLRLMAQSTHTPMHYFDPSGDVPSGESLRTADASLIKRAGFRQQRFGAGYSEALTFGLKVLGVKVGQKVDVRWESAASTDDQDSWETAGLKLKAGVPVRQVLMEQGYPAELVDEWIQSTGEDEAKKQIMLLAAAGDAAQRLIAAETLGGLPQGQSQAIMGNALNALTAAQQPQPDRRAA
jgi:hypothetical protein